MINKHELRIGNKLLLGSSVITVKELYDDEFKTPEEGFVSYGHPQLSGIPLTEEWLLKFGFKKTQLHSCHYWHRKNDDGMFLDWLTFLKPDMASYGMLGRARRDHFESYLQGDYKIFYIHQLSNLYFALTGEELQYKPESPLPKNTK